MRISDVSIIKHKVTLKCLNLIKINYYFLRFLLNTPLSFFVKIQLRKSSINKDNLTFLFFANLGYGVPIRLAKEAKKSGYFSSIQYLNDMNIKKFIQLHKNTFTKNRFEGFGFWLWKPYIIYNQLLKMHDNDILIYADSGVTINSGAEATLEKYIKYLRGPAKSIVCFSIFKDQKNWHPSLDLFYNEKLAKSIFPNLSVFDINWSYAGLILIKKNSDSLRIVANWLANCEMDLMLENYPDADNGIWHLVISAEDSVQILPGSEINLYHDNFLQLKHYLSNKSYQQLNWDLLYDKPFMYTRRKKGIQSWLLNINALKLNPKNIWR
jgi:hypothetical protein